MRKLATIDIVEDVRKHPDADTLDIIIVRGWQIISKSGNFKIGDKAVVFEIDSAFEKDSVVGLSLPVEKAIRVNTEEKGFIEGFRIKTIKLRGQISQGYALPLSYFRSFKGVNLEAEDLTFELNVLKYDKPESGFGMGPGFAKTAGNFPTDFIRKTDQERAQNLKHQIFEHYLSGTCFEVTYKLDGSSETIGRYEQGDEVKDVICSRNLALKLDEEDTTSQFISVGKPILEKLILGQHVNVALQGELVSPGIQKNFENVLNPALYIYSVWDVKGYKYLNPSKAREFVAELGANYVPVMHENITLQELFGEQIEDANELLAKLLEYAEGPSGLNGKYREGLVYKSEDGSFSFKTISNSYLLKEK